MKTSSHTNTNHTLTDLTITLVASELGLHAETVRRLLAQGDLPGYRAGGRWRVSRRQLDGFKKSGGVRRPGRPQKEDSQKEGEVGL